MKKNFLYLFIFVVAAGCGSGAGKTDVATGSDTTATSFSVVESSAPTSTVSAPVPVDNFPDYTEELLTEADIESEITAGITTLVEAFRSEAFLTYQSTYRRERDYEGDYDQVLESEDVTETWFFDDAFKLKAYTRKYYRDGQGRDTKNAVYFFSGDSLLAMSEYWNEDNQIGIVFYTRILASKCPNCGVRARREASGEGGVIEVTYDRADMANKSAQVVQRLSELVDPTDNRWTNETAGNYTMTEEVERWEAEGGKPYSIYYTVNDKLFDHLRFEVLLELYNTKDAQLPHKIAEYIADVDQTPTNFTAVEMLENEKYYFVLYNASKMVGGGLDELHGVTLSKDGQFLSGQFLGSAYPSSGPDGDGEDYSYNYDPEKHILTMTNTKIQWDEQSQQEVSTESISKYKVDGEGTIVEVK